MKPRILPVTVVLTALLIALLWSATTATASDSHPDTEQQIRSAVEELYIRGLQTREFDLITTICIPDALLMGARSDGTLRVTTLEKWSSRFEPDNPPFEKLEAKIEKIDWVGFVAQVKIHFVIDSTTDVTDFLNMVRIDGRWRIVNIIDH